tara:strand:+ start:275 stop:493 length:219 start_codon:yes stop_codon:yes gene_type:complete
MGELNGWTWGLSQALVALKATEDGMELSTNATSEAQGTVARANGFDATSPTLVPIISSALLIVCGMAWSSYD